MPDHYALEQLRTANMGMSRAWLRGTAVLWGVITFVWMAPEDDSLLPPVLLGLGLSVLVVPWLVFRLKLAARVRGGWSTLLTAAAGLMIGGGTGPCAVLLMLVKNARHAHLYPDYPPDVLLDILARVPHWALAGVLFGFGAACISWAVRPMTVTSEDK